MVLKLHRHYEGCYRSDAINGRFAQIKKDRSHWRAEIRNSNGDFIRPAGSWPTRRDAANECEHILKSA